MFRLRLNRRDPGFVLNRVNGRAEPPIIGPTGLLGSVFPACLPQYRLRQPNVCRPLVSSSPLLRPSGFHPHRDFQAGYASSLYTPRACDYGFCTPCTSGCGGWDPSVSFVPRLPGFECCGRYRPLHSVPGPRACFHSYGSRKCIRIWRLTCFGLFPCSRVCMAEYKLQRLFIGYSPPLSGTVGACVCNSSSCEHLRRVACVRYYVCRCGGWAVKRFSLPCTCGLAVLLLCRINGQAVCRFSGYAVKRVPEGAGVGFAMLAAVAGNWARTCWAPVSGHLCLPFLPLSAWKWFCSLTRMETS